MTAPGPTGNRRQRLKYWTSVAFVENPWELPEIARECEVAGFEGIVVPDHLVLPHNVDTYPYTPDGSPRWPDGTPWPDPWVAIGAMAAATERIRFATGVYVLPARNIFVTAKSVGTAAVMSRNRVVLGAGAGWCEREFELGEQPFDRRGARMEELIAGLRALWGDFDAAYCGDYVGFAEVDIRPLPTEPVPIWLGGDSDRALRRAASLADGWIGLDYSLEDLLPRLEALRRLRHEAGRGDEAFDVVVVVRAKPSTALHDQLSDAGVTGLITVPWFFTGKDPGPLENKIEGIHFYADRYL